MHVLEVCTQAKGRAVKRAVYQKGTCMCKHQTQAVFEDGWLAIDSNACCVNPQQLWQQTVKLQTSKNVLCMICCAMQGSTSLPSHVFRRVCCYTAGH